jgi:hypothetical protein
MMERYTSVLVNEVGNLACRIVVVIMPLTKVQVSRPEGQQRGRYVLQLPPRCASPMNITLHKAMRSVATCELSRDLVSVAANECSSSHGPLQGRVGSASVRACH